MWKIRSAGGSKAHGPAGNIAQTGAKGKDALLAEIAARDAAEKEEVKDDAEGV